MTAAHYFVDEAGDTTLFGRHGKLLLRHDMRLSAVVKEKHHLLADVRGHEAANPAHRYKADGHELYDDLIARLFSHFGAFGAQRHVTFAVRGSKPRTAALKAVLETIDQDFERDFGFAPHGHTTVHSSYQAKSAGLQACDYLLWALQRFYERQEERYLQPMWPKFARVLDLDAPAPKVKGNPQQIGAEFNEKHPLTFASRAGVWNKG